LTADPVGTEGPERIGILPEEQVLTARRKRKKSARIGADRFRCLGIGAERFGIEGEKEEEDEKEEEGDGCVWGSGVVTSLQPL
jgi:hypothetical protein